MASKIDMPLDSFVKNKPFGGQNKPYYGGQNRVGGFKKSYSENGAPMSDLRAVLAKKQAANITDLRTKLKPKALYTSNLSSRAKQQQQQQQQQQLPHGISNGKDLMRKPLKLTPSFKSSVSSAVSSSSGSSSSKSRSSRSGTESRRSRSSSHKLPSYEEAKKISVTVPGLSRPMSAEYPSHRREERLAAQIARSKEMRQDSYMRGREEFLASAITSAVGGAGGGGHGGGGHTRHERGERDRDRGSSAGMFAHMPASVSHKRSYPSRSPSPTVPEYSSYDPLYGLSGGSYKAPPPPTTYPSGGARQQRGITTATSMIISNLSDTVSKNDVAELCGVVGFLDGVYMHAPGIAEVVFKYKDDALEAYKKYNQRNLDGQPMHCKLQPASRSRMAAVPSGYGHSYADDFYSHPHGGSGLY